MAKESKVFKYHCQIREHHLDAYGHVNHVAYVALFEEARWDILSSAGMGLETIRGLGKGPIVLGMEVKYRKELKLRAQIVIESVMSHWTGKIGTMSQRLLDQEGAVCCEAKFTLGLFDLKERKLINAGQEWANVFGFESTSSVQKININS